MKHYGFAILASALLAVSPVQAKTWTIDPAGSHLGFSGRQGGATFQGGFKSFDVAADFDPDHPENAKIVVTVNISSIYAGDPSRDNELPKPEWFDVERFPIAKFTSTGVQWDRNPSQPMLRDNVGCYRMTGNLYLKGVTAPVTIPFCIAPAGGTRLHVKGGTTLMRNNFSIGVGQFDSDSYIGYNVDLIIDLMAQ